MPLVTRVGACEIQRLHGEWLVLMCRDTTGVSNGVLVKSQRSSVQERIPLKRHDATYVCLDRVLVELSVYDGSLFISHRWVEIRIDERPHSANRFQTITSTSRCVKSSRVV